MVTIFIGDKKETYCHHLNYVLVILLSWMLQHNALKNEKEFQDGHTDLFYGSVQYQ